MNAQRDPWAELLQECEPPHFPPMTPEEQQAMADEYQREQIASVQSEMAEQAAIRSYSK